MQRLPIYTNPVYAHTPFDSWRPDEIYTNPVYAWCIQTPKEAHVETAPPEPVVPTGPLSAVEQSDICEVSRLTGRVEAQDMGRAEATRQTPPPAPQPQRPPQEMPSSAPGGQIPKPLGGQQQVTPLGDGAGLPPSAPVRPTTTPLADLPPRRNHAWGIIVINRHTIVVWYNRKTRKKKLDPGDWNTLSAPPWVFAESVGGICWWPP